jgi:hypothetical protein
MQFTFSRVQSQASLEAYVRTLGVMPPYAAPPLQTPWVTALINKGGWVGSGPYEFTIANATVEEKSVPFMQYHIPRTAAAALVDKMLHAYELIDTVITADGVLVLRAEHVPTCDFYIDWKILTVVDMSEIPQTLDDTVISNCEEVSTVDGRLALRFSLLNLLTKAITLLDVPLSVCTDTHAGLVPAGTLGTIQNILTTLSGITQTLIQISQRVDTIEGRVDDIEEDLVTVQNLLSWCENHITTVEGDVSIIKVSLTTIRSTLDTIQAKIGAYYVRAGLPGNFVAGPSSVTKTVSTVNLGTGLAASLQETYPIATAEHAGFITASDYESIQWTVQQIQVLIEQISSGVTTIWYQNEIGSLFPTEADLPASNLEYPTLVVGAQALVADYQDTGTRAHYICTGVVGTTATWRFLYTDEQAPNIATTSVTGVVKGSVAPGQVYVEVDGKMSLNGYDLLVQSVNTLSNQVLELNQNLSTLSITVSQIRNRQSLTHLMDILPSLPPAAAYNDLDKVLVRDGLLLCCYVKSAISHDWEDLI